MTKLTAEHRRLIVTWAEQGHAPGVIAKKLADCHVYVSSNHVGVILNEERRAGTAIRPFLEPGGKKRIRVDVRQATLPHLVVHADRRGISPEVLAGRLLDVIASDGMVDNVLDDGVGS